MGDEHAPVLEMYEPAVADHRHALAGEPHPGPVVRRSEADEPTSIDPAGHRRCVRSRLGNDRLVELHGFGPGEPEPVPGSGHAEALMRPLEVVLVIVAGVGFEPTTSGL